MGWKKQYPQRPLRKKSTHEQKMKDSAIKAKEGDYRWQKEGSPHERRPTNVRLKRGRHQFRIKKKEGSGERKPGLSRGKEGILQKKRMPSISPKMDAFKI